MVDKKLLIKLHVREMLEVSHKAALAKIEKALDSGAVDIDGYDPDVNPMLLPKSILIAILESETEQYDARGTSFEKKIKKDSKRIKIFL